MPRIVRWSRPESNHARVVRAVATWVLVCVVAPVRGHAAVDRAPRVDQPGFPWLSVTAPYAIEPAGGASRAVLPALAPRTLASGDVDQDGVPDLVVGYASARGGAVAVFRGNVDALHPNAPEARAKRAAGHLVDSPFLPDPALHEVPEPADFVAVGDFDADGRWDVATAARGGRALYHLRGDAQGALADASAVALTGEVTALATGDVNRRDGLADLVVAVSDRSGDVALVFESQDGALRAKPERVALPRAASDLAIGRLGGEPYAGFVAATGSSLTLVHGRDRQLALEPAARKAAAARVESVALGFEAVSVAIGELEGGYESAPDLAALGANGAVQILSRDGRAGDRFTPTRRIASGASRLTKGRLLVTSQVTSVPLDEVLVLDAAGRGVRLVESASDLRAPTGGAPLVTALPGDGAPVAALAMRLNKHAFSSLVVLRAADPTPVVIEVAPTAIFTIDTTADTTDFNGNDGLCLDAQGHCSLHAAKDQANITPGLQEFDFNLPGTDPTIPYGADLFEPVTIDGTTQPGYAGTPIVAISFSCNCSGIAIGGNGAASNSSVRGLLVNGGLTPAIAFIPASNNIVEGNWIGVDRTGQAASSPANDNGIVGFGGANNRIGGTVAAARNVISGNGGRGFTSNPSAHTVQGNYIGVSADGLHAVGNGREGIEGVDTLMTIGGTTAGAPNVIAANAASNGNAQISIGDPTGDPDSLLIQGNLIGTDRTGTVALGAGGSAAGVRGFGLQGTTIGGTSPAARNVIAGAGGNGIEFLGGAGNFLVQGNWIGLAVDGASPLGNGGNGVFVSGGGGTIGGSASGAPNRVAFNGGTGLCVPSPANVRFQQNSIHSNGQIGIDLNSGGSCNGVTSNDGGDGDGGANGQLNFPSITSVSGAHVQGTYSSTASAASYTLEFFSSASCDPSGNGEGRTYRGSTVVNTDASGNGSFDATLASEIPTGQAVTATATDAGGATSEFSGCTTAGGSTSVELDPPGAPIQVGGSLTLTGGNFTPGTVLKMFVATSSGVVDVFPSGLARDSGSATSWTATLPFPWPVGGVNAASLGNGFVSMFLVRTDQGYDTSNTVGAVLHGNASLGEPVPTITALAGVPLSATSSQLSIRTANVEGLVPVNTTLTITGSAFASPLVNLFTASGNVGPLTPTSSTSTSIDVLIPANAPVGPGSVQVVNASAGFRSSNAVSIPIGELITISSIGVNGATVTVNGTGFNGLTVINLFAGSGGNVVNAGGLDGNGDPRIPLSLVDSHQFTFARPGGLDAGPAYVQAINPPFIPYTNSGDGPEGAFTLP